MINSFKLISMPIILNIFMLANLLTRAKFLLIRITYGSWLTAFKKENDCFFKKDLIKYSFKIKFFSETENGKKTVQGTSNEYHSETKKNENFFLYSRKRYAFKSQKCFKRIKILWLRDLKGSLYEDFKMNSYFQNHFFYLVRQDLIGLVLKKML